MPTTGSTTPMTICSLLLKLLLLLLVFAGIVVLVGLPLALCIMVVLVEERTEVIGISDLVNAGVLVLLVVPLAKAKVIGAWLDAFNEEAVGVRESAILNSSKNDSYQPRMP
jgi:hypothetical protein